MEPNYIVGKLSRALVFAALLMGGCTYDGTLEKSFYKSQRTVQDNHRIDLRVAVINDKELQNKKFEVATVLYGANVSLGNSIAEAVRDELQTLFTVAHVIQDHGEGDYDLYANLRFDTRRIYQNRRAGQLVADLQLDLQLTASDQAFDLGTYRATDRVNYVPPAEAGHGKMLTEYTLGLASPFSLPYTTNALGKKAKKVIRDSLQKLVSSIGEQVERSNSVTTFYAMTKPKIVAAIANPLSHYKKLTSPYDKFLEGVVVIQQSDSTGTGFFITNTGYVVTNNHVVGDSNTVMVRSRDGRVFPGKLIDSDAIADLALVKIDRQDATPLGISDGAEAGIGRNVLAIGTPQGLSWSVSRGIVSAVRDTKRARYIQTDAAINIGNSGGPLIDLESGLVIGVNTLVVRKDMAEGLNFAVSTEDVWRAFRHHFQR